MFTNIPFHCRMSVGKRKKINYFTGKDGGMTEGERTLAVFIDFENLALWIQGQERQAVRDPEGLGKAGRKGKDHREEGLRGLD